MSKNKIKIQVGDKFKLIEFDRNQSFQQLIQAISNQTNMKNIRFLQYIDDEKDWIHMTSDIELKEAFDSFGGEYLTIKFQGELAEKIQEQPKSTEEISITIIPINEDSKLELKRGQQKQFRWLISNQGTENIEGDVAFTFVGGDKLSKQEQIHVEKLSPKEPIEISVNVEAPQKTGRFISFWRIKIAGESYGNKGWIDLTVK
ncbi:ovarian carcinoma antigen [Anaeramoeba ignava]|uniref:Ovarian carcinoma antigen n=1 Tax=Anaeramoeba ignava TaxID=1746090 RepID=A0A9Q0R4I0_ANAIG|nr:ovarian carcinoma antigen [Anaeramoeba ignava]|eukprot:Anaeramoba_ignava/a362627_41.p1 GENE.a362627_41~~a362627_41.p1  ORF type:complete len:214 (-),score=88.42 a362627_41:82-687(-)